MTRLTRTMKVCLALVAMAALPACSLTNAPEPLPPEPYDGGADGGPVDGEVEGDGDVDADGGPSVDASRPLHEICFNGEDVDDDGDGATDCGDLDCASDASCCGVGLGGALIDERWTECRAIAGNWRFDTEDTIDTFCVSDGAPLSSFGTDHLPHSLMPDRSGQRCVPLALGATIEVTFHPATCAGCDDYAAIVLTGADGPASGSALAADLRVGVGPDGSFTVMSGATKIPTTGNALDASGRVVIKVSAGAADGIAVLSARILTGPSGSELPVVHDAPFIAQSLLRACPGVAAVPGRPGLPGGPGLNIAVEGSGSSVGVGPLLVTPLACANSRVFLPAGNVITSADVAAVDDWASGGIGAPALLPEVGFNHLFYDATNVERDLESIAPVAFAIGTAQSASFDGTWTSPKGADMAVGHAFVGTTPPACTTPGCARERSVREPSAGIAYASNGAFDDRYYFLAFARETAPSSDVFAIEYIDAPVDISSVPPAPVSDGTRTLVPATSGGCTSVRDPAVAQADITAASGLWLFYTCEHGLNASTIRAVALRVSGGRYVQRPGTDVEVLGPGIGAYAAHGVSGSAALVRVIPGALPTLAVRLWFIARGLDGRRSLALAEGQVKMVSGVDATTQPIPALQPYPANPLLYGNAPELGGCVGTCILRDVAIGRLPNSTALTMLVARSVDLTGGGTEWQLIPLSQTLEAAWWGTP